MISELTPGEIRLVARVARKLGFSSVKLTGGEPTVRRDITEIIAGIRDAGFDDISMTTNGFTLSDIAHKLREAGLRRVNVSLHSLRRERFRKITGVDGLDRALAGIRASKEAGLDPVKINFVLTSENSDEVWDILDFAGKQGLEVHLIELHPVGMGKEAFQKHIPFSKVEQELSVSAIRIEVREKHLRPRYVMGNGTVVEVVKPYANPYFCAGCNRIRLSADGKLKTCLYRDDLTVDIIEVLRGKFKEEEKLELLERAFLIANLLREPNFKLRETTALMSKELNNIGI